MLSPQDRPILYHSLQQKKSSVLALAADANYIFSGSQADDISVSHGTLWQCAAAEPAQVWDKRTFKLKTTLRGHTASVLALEYAPERKWLLSASGAAEPRILSY